ncbi:MAG: SAM-dependent chlorinase/fluorinase [Acidimicrobiia bacterium]|nr:SAM-dependent chlorinase/fluorinase [Acidimicrobiia bacterium]
MPGPAPMRFDTISFLSDFGTVDEFVGVVHSVIRSLAPAVGVVDIAHQLPPHDVRAGGLTLARSVQFLCPGVVLAVVDPGVATDRRAVAVEVGDGQAYLVGPDNGLLAPAVALVGGAQRAVALTNPEYHLAGPGPTFAGRDIFAPVAAHLCMGVPLEALGELVDPSSLRPGLMPLTRQEGDRLLAEVLWVDRFGNAQLNVDPVELAPYGDAALVTAASLDGRGTVRRARRVVAYAELATGELGLAVDSYGLIALVMDRASAADELGLDAGAEVVLGPLDDGSAGVELPVELTSRRDRR